LPEALFFWCRHFFSVIILQPATPTILSLLIFIFFGRESAGSHLTTRHQNERQYDNSGTFPIL